MKSTKVDQLICKGEVLNQRLERIAEILKKFRPEAVGEIDLQAAVKTFGELWVEICSVHQNIVHLCEDKSFDNAMLRQEQFERCYLGLKTRLLKLLKMVTKRDQLSPTQGPSSLNVIAQFAAQQAEFLRLLSASMACAPTPPAIMHSEAFRLSQSKLPQSAQPSKPNPPHRGSTVVFATNPPFCENCSNQSQCRYQCANFIQMIPNKLDHNIKLCLKCTKIPRNCILPLYSHFITLECHCT